MLFVELTLVVSARVRIPDSDTFIDVEPNVYPVAKHYLNAGIRVDFNMCFADSGAKRHA